MLDPVPLKSSSPAEISATSCPIVPTCLPPISIRELSNRFAGNGNATENPT